MPEFRHVEVHEAAGQLGAAGGCRSFITWGFRKVLRGRTERVSDDGLADRAVQSRQAVRLDCRSAVTSLPSALPWLAFMAAPTRAPIALSSPPTYFAQAAALSAMT